MKKFIKLFILGIVLIGAVIGIMLIVNNGSGSEERPEFSSYAANEWKESIDSLCQPGKWTDSGYSSLENGIRIDKQYGNISIDEEIALQNYLFATSCEYLNNQVDELFKQASYPPEKVKDSEEMLEFLSERLEANGSNSNYTEASNLVSEYHQLLAATSFGSAAPYSHPLRAYNAMSAETAKNRVKSLKHYPSHFSKNPTMRERVANIDYNRSKAEREYYDNLATSVINHYNSVKTGNRSAADNALYDDQIRFSEISTNSSATSRLNNFVNNPNR